MLTGIVELLEAHWLSKVSRNTERGLTVIAIRVERPDGCFLSFQLPAVAVLLEVMKKFEEDWGRLAHQQSLRLDFDHITIASIHFRTRFTYEDCDYPVMSLAKGATGEREVLRLVVSPQRARISKPIKGSPTRVSMEIWAERMSVVYLNWRKPWGPVMPEDGSLMIGRQYEPRQRRTEIEGSTPSKDDEFRALFSFTVSPRTQLEKVFTRIAKGAALQSADFVLQLLHKDELGTA